MDSRILEIVFYLMDQSEDSDEQLSGISEYSSDLRNLGYSDEEISTAFNWILDHLSAPGESLYSAFPDGGGSHRILTETERARLTPQAYGFLLKLSHMGVIDDHQVEKILDRLGVMGTNLVTADQIKLVASAVIFNERSKREGSVPFDPAADQASRVN